MILNVSGRTDIVAFYTKWFMRRYKEGYVDVRNPFYKTQVSRIYFQDVDLILFCTKNPRPIIPYLKEINKKIVFHITITPYKKDIEPNVDKNQLIASIKKVSEILGRDRIFIRYDPIFINEKYTLNYHLKAFERLCHLLFGYTNHIIVSFLDDYKNVRKNIGKLNPKILTKDDYEQIGKSFSEIASKYHMSVQTCAEEETLFEYGFIKEDCMSKSLAKKLTGKNYKKGTFRGKKCACVEMVDIGVYNTCSHFCKYCYANFDETQVQKNKLNHHPTSSLLIGTLNSEDIIKVRKG